MALVGGKVTVNDAGNFGGTGLALVMFLAFKKQDDEKAIEEGRAAKFEEQLAALAKLFPGEDRRAVRQKRIDSLKQGTVDAVIRTRKGWADQVNVLAPSIVAYVQANAEISLSGVVATLDAATSAGRVPDPADPGAPLLPPAAPVALPVTGEAGAVLRVA